MRWLLTVLAIMLVVPQAASAHLVTRPQNDQRSTIHRSQLENLAHARYVCREGANAHQRWSCRAVKWLGREAAETRATPRNGPFPIDGCTRTLLGREGGMNPTIYNRQGSGAYGGPQALPGHKMSSAGPDWRTNIWTQIRWMIGYMNGRYGSSCAALSFHDENGYY